MTTRNLFAAVAGALVLCAAPVGSFGAPGAQTTATATASASERTAMTVLRDAKPHDALFAIAMDGDHAIGVGAPGLLLTSDDDATTWVRRDTPTDAALLGVALKDGRALAVGQSGTILLGRSTPSSGASTSPFTWKAVPSGTDARLFGVALDGEGAAVAVGAFGALLRSTDGGESWSAPSLDWRTIGPDGMEPHLYAVRAVPDGFVAVGEFGMILRSADRGATWSAKRVGEASLFDLTIDDHGNGVAVGQRGAVVTTRDGGATWNAGASLTDSALLGVWLSGGHGRIVGIHSAYRSDDGGRTWVEDEPGDTATAWYQAIAGRDRPVVVGHGGRVVAFDR